MNITEKSKKNKQVVKNNADNSFSDSDLGHIVRLSLEGKTDEVRLFIARLVRKYRASRPELAEQFDGYLRATAQKRSVMRKSATHDEASHLIPSDEDTKLSLLKILDETPDELKPLFSSSLKAKLEQLVKERRHVDILLSEGLLPARSAIFTGPPGVGKTLAARWIASQLQIPLYILDLTTVMSSLLGKTGANLRSVLDFARTTPCVLFLDEIDSIAKRRSDNADVGELKRLVTIMLQEIEDWPGKSLLLAATNFPELLDPAIWRRFDAVIDFPLPDQNDTLEAITLFSGKDKNAISKWQSVLCFILKDKSYSDIEKTIYQLRRANTLNERSFSESIKDLFGNATNSLNKNERKDIALQIAKDGLMPIRTIAELTGIHRDTIAKHTKAERAKKKVTNGST